MFLYIYISRPGGRSPGSFAWGHEKESSVVNVAENWLIIVTFSLFSDDFSPKNEKISPGAEKSFPHDLSKTRSGALGNRFFDPKT